MDELIKIPSTSSVSFLRISEAELDEILEMIIRYTKVNVLEQKKKSILKNMF
jgi:hypothetical protein